MKKWYKKLKAVGWEIDEKNSYGIKLMRSTNNAKITEYIDLQVGKTIKKSSIMYYAETWEDGKVVKIPVMFGPETQDGIEELRKSYKLDKELVHDWYKKY